RRQRTPQHPARLPTYPLSLHDALPICSAMCARSSNISGIDHNLAAEGLEANSMKAVVTDLMHESSQLLVQVSGANGYKITHIGGRGIMDSRPFQIFEGSNEMLYSQIAEMVTRVMKKQKESHLFDFLKEFNLTSEASSYFKNEINFTLDGSLTQRRMVDFGMIFGRIVCIGYVLELQHKGFRKDLVENCIKTVRHEVSSLVSSFRFDSNTTVVEDYTEESSWLKFV